MSDYWLGTAAERLFYTDEEGNPTDPDDVIADALDGGWVDLEPDVIALLEDPAEHPSGRFLACCALVSWGSSVGYNAVSAAARNPESVSWRGWSYDRWSGADDTFGVLAEGIGDSHDMACDRGTLDSRLQALAALIAISDRCQFGRRLVQALRDEDIRLLADQIRVAISSGIARIRGRESVGFDLPMQMAGLISALYRVAPASALTVLQEFIQIEPAKRALDELGPIDISPHDRS